MKRKIIYSVLGLLLVVSTKVVSQNLTWLLQGSPLDTTGWIMQGYPAGQPFGDYIQLAPEEISKSGALYYNQPINLSQCDKWSISISYRIMCTKPLGLPDRLPGDGLAFWFLKNPPGAYVAGAGFGIPNYANGLAVAIDLYDNSGGKTRKPVLEIYELNGADISFGGAQFEDSAKQIKSLNHIVSYSDESLVPPYSIAYAGYDNLQPTIAASTFTDTSTWSNMIISYDNGTLGVYLVNYRGVVFSTTYYTTNDYNYSGYIGFSASTGGVWSSCEVKNGVITINKQPDVNEKDTTLLLCGPTLDISIDPALNTGNDTITWSIVDTLTGIETILLGPSLSATDLTVTKPGKYRVQVKTLCNKIFKDYNILKPVFDSLTIVNPDCSGSNSGKLIAHVSGGTGNYGYSLDGLTFQADNVFDNLPPGDYKFTISDRMDPMSLICYQHKDVTLVSPISIDSTIVVDVDCSGSNSGELDVYAKGGTPPYSFSIDGSTWFEEPIGVTNHKFTGLNAGAYNVFIVDVDTICLAKGNYTIKQLNSIHIDTIITTPVSCNGGSDGTSILKISGGTPFPDGSYDYTYTYSGGTGIIFPDEFSSWSAETINVTITDALGCSKDTFFTITEPSALAANIVIDSIQCYGSKDGKFDVRVSGGNGGYLYNYSSNINSSNLVSGNDSLVTALDAGTYIVTVTDKKGCSITDTIELYNPQQIKIDTIITDSVMCFGTSTGTVDVRVSMGVPPYNYSYIFEGTPMPSLVGSFIDTLSAGHYDVKVTDSRGCTSISKSFDILEPIKLKIDSIIPNSPSCFGYNNGSLIAHASGGTRPYSFTILGDTTSHNSSDSLWDQTLAGGIYKVIVTDYNGCTDTMSQTISQSSPIFISSITTVSPQCNGVDGSLTVLMNPSVGVYEYSIDTGISWQSSPSFIDLAGGYYLITSRTPSGCQDTMSVNLSSPSSLVIDTIITTPVSCNGGSDGTSILNISGGTPFYNGTYSYSYTYGSNTGVPLAKDITFWSAGNVSVRITDSLGCSKDTFFTITEPPALTVNIVIDSIQCYGSKDGKFDVQVSGGSGGYVYNYSSNINSSNLVSGNDSLVTALDAGLYIITVNDKNGCSFVDTIELYNPQQIKIDTIITDSVMCFGTSTGTVDVRVGVGVGVPPYNYSYFYEGIPMPSLVDPVIDTLFAGHYDVKVTDSRGCISELKSFDILEPIKLKIDSIIPNSPSCLGYNNGSLIVHASGGTRPYSFTILGDTTSHNTSDSLWDQNLYSGIYKIIVTDNNGCIDTMSGTIYDPSPIFISSITPVSPQCNGADGSLTVLMDPSIGVYEYSIDSGISWQSSPSFIGLAGGYYLITSRTPSGCQDTMSVNLSSPSSLVIDTIIVDSSKCNGDNDGSLEIFVSGGTTPYKYSINGGLFQSNSIFNGLTKGSYAVEVMDFNSCSVTENVYIYAPNSLIIDSVSVDSVQCNGSSDGKFVFHVTGGTFPYMYSSDNVTFQSDSLFNSGSGIHRFYVTDAHNCIDSIDVYMPEPTKVTIDSVSVDSVQCNDSSDGTFVVHATGGTSPYMYSLDNVNFQSDSLFNIGVGTYRLYSKDSHGCIDSIDVYMPEPLKVTISSVSVNSVQCNGSLDGTFVVHATGGTSPYMYSLDNVTFQPDSTFMKGEGTYSLYVTDFHGCTDSIDVYMPEPLKVTIDSVSVDSVQCNGSSDGKFVVHVTGGTSPYMYSLDNVIFQSDSLFNSGVGTYRLYSRDSHGCTDSIDIYMPEPLKVTIDSVSVDSVQCQGSSDGTFVVHVTGGTSPYMYSLDNVTFQLDSLFNIGVGTYRLYSRDSHGCIDSIDVYMPEPTKVTIDSVSVDSVQCNGDSDGTFVVHATGGTSPYTYSLDNVTFQSDSLFNSGVGTYRLYSKDSHGCTDSIDVYMPEPLKVTIDSVSVDSVQCNGSSDGKFVVHVTGGTSPYVYSLDNVTFQSDSLFMSSEGTYRLYSRDSHGCIDSIDVYMPEPLKVTIDSVSVDSVQCNGSSDGKFVVHVTGGTSPYMYSSDNFNFQLDSTFYNGEGTHRFYSKDSHGCIDSIDVYMPEPKKINIARVSVDSVQCQGSSDGQFVIHAIGGTSPYSYSIDGFNYQTDSLFTVSEGNYILYVKDLHGCSTSINKYMPEPLKLSIHLEKNDSVLCYGSSTGKILVSSSGGTSPYKYQLNGSPWVFSPQFNNLPIGSYSIIVEDSHGCKDSLNTNLYEPTPLFIDTVVADSVWCFGTSTGAIEIMASGGVSPYLYSIDNGISFHESPIFTSLSTKSYTVVVLDANNCSEEKIVHIGEPEELVLNTLVDSVTCFDRNDGKITAKVSGGEPPYRYSLDNGVTWGSDSVFSDLSEGVYELRVRDIMSCELYEKIDIPNLSANLTLNDEILFDCESKFYTVILYGEGGSGGYEYNFGDGWQTSNESGSLDSGTYIFEMRDIYCGLNITVKLDVPFDESAIDIRLPEELCMRENNTIDITHLTAYESYTLYYHEDGQSLISDINANRSGDALLELGAHDSTYILHLDSIIPKNEDSYCLHYDLNKSYTIPLTDCSLFIYDIFTPNGDGSNDYFTIRGINHYPNNKLEIFNRWGALVYVKEGYDNSWDGTPNSNKIGKKENHLPPGVYMCVLTIEGMEPIQKTINIIK